jgi:hypothetical protein
MQHSGVMQRTTAHHQGDPGDTAQGVADIPHFAGNCIWIADEEGP